MASFQSSVKDCGIFYWQDSSIWRDLAEVGGEHKRKSPIDCIGDDEDGVTIPIASLNS